MIESALLIACLESGVDHELIQAIATQESASVSTAFYINKWNMNQFSGLSLDEAVLVSEKMIDEGYTVDVGLMGINSRNIARFNLSVAEAFEPCTNIKLGERILSENMRHAESLGHAANDVIQVALSMYNTGSVHRGFANGYVDKVWTLYSSYLNDSANESEIDVAWSESLPESTMDRERPSWITSD